MSSSSYLACASASRVLYRGTAGEGYAGEGGYATCVVAASEGEESTLTAGAAAAVRLCSKVGAEEERVWVVCAEGMGASQWDGAGGGRAGATRGGKPEEEDDACTRRRSLHARTHHRTHDFDIDTSTHA